jgi:hypothetical protein
VSFLPGPSGPPRKPKAELTRSDYAFLMIGTVVATLTAAVVIPYIAARVLGAPLAEIWVLPLEIIGLFVVYQLWLRRLAAKPRDVSEEFE